MGSDGTLPLPESQTFFGLPDDYYMVHYSIQHSSVRPRSWLCQLPRVQRQHCLARVLTTVWYRVVDDTVARWRRVGLCELPRVQRQHCLARVLTTVWYRVVGETVARWRHPELCELAMARHRHCFCDSDSGNPWVAPSSGSLGFDVAHHAEPVEAGVWIRSRGTPNLRLRVAPWGHNVAQDATG